MLIESVSNNTSPLLAIGSLLSVVGYNSIFTPTPLPSNSREIAQPNGFEPPLSKSISFQTDRSDSTNQNDDTAVRSSNRWERNIPDKFRETISTNDDTETVPPTTVTHSRPTRKITLSSQTPAKGGYRASDPARAAREAWMAENERKYLHCMKGFKIPQPSTSDHIEMGYLVLAFLLGAPLNLIALTKLNEQARRSGSSSGGGGIPGGTSSPGGTVNRRLLLLKLHLNVTDLGVIFVYSTSRLCWLATYEWRGGRFLCPALLFAHSLAFHASSFLVVVIAADRFATVAFPTRHCGPRATRRIKLALCCGWLAATCASLPQLAVWREFTPFPMSAPRFTQCVTVWTVRRFREACGWPPPQFLASSHLHNSNVKLGYNSYERNSSPNEDFNIYSQYNAWDSYYHDSQTYDETDTYPYRMQRVYSVVHTALTFWLPATISAVCYAFIMCWVCQNLSRKRLHSSTETGGGVSSSMDADYKGYRTETGVTDMFTTTDATGPNNNTNYNNNNNNSRNRALSTDSCCQVPNRQLQRYLVRLDDGCSDESIIQKGAQLEAELAPTASTNHQPVDQQPETAAATLPECTSVNCSNGFAKQGHLPICATLGTPDGHPAAVLCSACGLGAVEMDPRMEAMLLFPGDHRGDSFSPPPSRRRPSPSLIHGGWSATSIFSNPADEQHHHHQQQQQHHKGSHIIKRHSAGNRSHAMSLASTLCCASRRNSACNKSSKSCARRHSIEDCDCCCDADDQNDTYNTFSQTCRRVSPVSVDAVLTTGQDDMLRHNYSNNNTVCERVSTTAQLELGPSMRSGLSLVNPVTTTLAEENESSTADGNSPHHKATNSRLDDSTCCDEPDLHKNGDSNKYNITNNGNSLNQCQKLSSLNRIDTFVDNKNPGATRDPCGDTRRFPGIPLPQPTHGSTLTPPKATTTTSISTASTFRRKTMQPPTRTVTRLSYGRSQSACNSIPQRSNLSILKQRLGLRQDDASLAQQQQLSRDQLQQQLLLATHPRLGSHLHHHICPMFSRHDSSVSPPALRRQATQELLGTKPTTPKRASLVLPSSLGVENRQRSSSDQSPGGANEDGTKNNQSNQLESQTTNQIAAAAATTTSTSTKPFSCHLLHSVIVLHCSCCGHCVFVPADLNNLKARWGRNSDSATMSRPSVGSVTCTSGHYHYAVTSVTGCQKGASQLGGATVTVVRQVVSPTGGMLLQPLPLVTDAGIAVKRYGANTGSIPGITGHLPSGYAFVSTAQPFNPPSKLVTNGQNGPRHSLDSKRRQSVTFSVGVTGQKGGRVVATGRPPYVGTTSLIGSTSLLTPSGQATVGPVLGGSGELRGHSKRGSKDSSGKPDPYEGIARARKKIFRSTLLIVAAYILCWAPYNVLFLIDIIDNAIYTNHVESHVYFLFGLIVFNSVLNPLFYARVLDCKRRHRKRLRRSKQRQRWADQAAGGDGPPGNFGKGDPEGGKGVSEISNSAAQFWGLLSAAIRRLGSKPSDLPISDDEDVVVAKEIEKNQKRVIHAKKDKPRRSSLLCGFGGGNTNTDNTTTSRGPKPHATNSRSAAGPGGTTTSLIRRAIFPFWSAGGTTSSDEQQQQPPQEKPQEKNGDDGDDDDGNEEKEKPVKKMNLLLRGLTSLSRKP